MSVWSRPLPIGRLAAGALALVVLAGAVEVILLPMARVFTGDPEREAMRETIAHHRFIADAEPRLKAALAAPSADPRAEAGARFDEPTDALALARLQTLVRGLAERATVEVTATEPLPVPTNAATAPGKLALTVTLSGRLAGLQAVIHGVEAARPLLFVTRCVIDRGGVERAGAEGGDPLLVARLTITGYRGPAT